MSNRTYDLVVLLDADAPTETRTKIVTDAEALLNAHGTVKAQKDWGTRQLPYLIDHHEEAEYHVFQFESAPDAIKTLDRGFKLTEGVLRFRIFETKAGMELPGNPPIFRREERPYERPPKNVAATPELDDSPSAPTDEVAPVVDEVPAAEAAAESADEVAAEPVAAVEEAAVVPAEDTPAADEPAE